MRDDASTVSASPNVIFSYGNSLDCSMSKDLFEHLFNEGYANGHEDNGSKYVSVRLCSYNKYQHSKILRCVPNGQLPIDTVEVPSKVFGVIKSHPTIDTCELLPFKQVLPILESIAICLKPLLYHQLLGLPTKEDQLKFIQLKCHIENKLSVIHSGDILWESWCRVVDCANQFQGVFDIEYTNVLLICDEEDPQNVYDTPDHANNFNLAQPGRVRLKLLGLPFEIEHNLITPIPSITEDDSRFVFSDAHTLMNLGVTSGSYVRISHGETSRVVKIFVLLSPNEFLPSILYASPRIVANFKDFEDVFVEKWSFSVKQLPLASSVSLARVGSWNNCQRAYESIILRNLTEYLTGKNRVLDAGDFLPVTFDSNFAPLCSEEIGKLAIEAEDDSIVWFKVDKVSFEEPQDYSSGFIINSSKTTLVTENLISESPLTLSTCNYYSFYSMLQPYQYDLKIFDYAHRFFDLMKVGIKCYQRGIKVASTVLLHSSTPSVGKRTLVESAALRLGVHLTEIDCMSIGVISGSADITNKTVGFLRAKLEPLLPFTSPSIVFLSHLDSILEKEDAQQDPNSSRVIRSLGVEMANLIDGLCKDFSGVIFVASVNDCDKLPESVRCKMKFELQVPVPTEIQRQHIFQWYLSLTELNQGSSKGVRFCAGQDVIPSKLALKSAGLTPMDIKSIIQVAKANALDRVIDKESFHNEYVLFGHFIPITNSDLSSAIERARDEFSDAIGAPKIPNVTWDDIGGMDMVKGEIMDTIDLPLKHPELFSSGMKKRSGILFYGPPGTGKTLLAKAIATNFSLNFFSVKGPELLNMYIGESEANVRRVFQKARDAKPCVIFFDELDSVAPKRGNQGDSGGVMDRIVSQLLAELDGMSSAGDGVFVIGATNRPDLLDEALLRPGRFDKMLYLGISDTDCKQENILKALTRKFELSEDVSLSDVAKGCPFTYTGADFYALCSDAILNAMTRTSAEVDKKLEEYNLINSKPSSLRYWFDKVATDEDTNVVVKVEDFNKARDALIPSVSEEELTHYLRIKASFETA